jgi:polyphosphate kinase
VEALVPIKAPPLMEELREFLDLQLEDRYGAWILGPDGDYQRCAGSEDGSHAQAVMLERTRQDSEKAGRSAQP